MEGQLNEEFHVLCGVSVTRTRVPAKDRDMLRKDSSELLKLAPQLCRGGEKGP